MVGSLRGILRSNNGQALIEMSLIAPIDVIAGLRRHRSRICNQYILNHDSYDQGGANLASRGGSLPIDKNGANYTNPTISSTPSSKPPHQPLARPIRDSGE